MPDAWHLVRVKHASTAFSGEAAAKTSGRWNSLGVPVVYTSASKSLAALETLVHLNPPVLLNYKVFRIHFEKNLVERVKLSSLPPDWRAEPPPSSTKALVDRWVREARTPVLALPSVIIPDELNFLFNPVHPAFKKCSIGPPEDFAFDLSVAGLLRSFRQQGHRSR